MKKLPDGKKSLSTYKSGDMPSLKPLIVPGIVALIVLIASILLAYSLGYGQGRDSANQQRDSFYRERITELAGFGASTPTPPPVNTLTPQPIDAPSPTPNVPVISRQDSLFARIDKIEGEQLTLLLLGPTGIPTGQVLVINIGREIRLYQSSNTVIANLKPGDNVLLSTTREGTNPPQVQNLVVLPTP
jgi:hypothetical protein